MMSLYLNHNELIGFCKSVTGGANQKFPSFPFPPVGGGSGGSRTKNEWEFLGLPRERSERPEVRQVFRSKWVRAKVSISPPNVTSASERKLDDRAEGAGEGKKRRRFATKSLGTGVPKRADLSLFRI